MINNDEILAAIRAKLIADTTLVDNDHLAGQHVYQIAQRDLDTEALNAWVTLFCVSPGEEASSGIASQLWQVDVWGRESARAARVASRVSETLGYTQRGGGGTLPALTTRRMFEPIYEELAPPDQIEEDGLIHKVRQFRVATVALA